MEFTEIQQGLLKARKQRETTESNLFATKEKLNKIRREKGQFLRFKIEGQQSTTARLQEFEQSEKDLSSSIDEISAVLEQNKNTERDLFNEFLSFTDPEKTISRLNDSFPILLFPLRVETRFMNIEADGEETKHQLWARVFPDDIAIDTFEEFLSENEVRNAQSYWCAMWQAGDIEEDQRAAWRSLVGNHGSGRAFWIIQNYGPANKSEKPERTAINKINLIINADAPLLNDEKEELKAFWEAIWRAKNDKDKQTDALNKLTGKVGEARALELREKYMPVNFSQTPPAPLTHEEMAVEAAFIIFPKPDDVETKFQSWAKAPKVNILPERLVLMGFNKNSKEPEIKVIGNPIPADLSIGPDPSANEGEQFKIADFEQEIGGRLYKKGDLIVGNELRWMFDFEEAVDKGMAFKIDLTNEQSRSGFDRLFVLGINLLMDNDEGKCRLETLIEHHHYGRKGFGIIMQGTPTNNTEKESSAYSWREDSDDSFNTYFKGSAPDHPAGFFEKSDGLWLSEMLGIDKSVLENTANYYGTDQRESKAMNMALWPATMGYFLETMLSPLLSKQFVAYTKSFFQHFVSGRGMIPAIRVGRQPYGILPVTAFSRMNWLQAHLPGSHSKLIAAFFDNAYLNKLYNVLRRIDGDWKSLLGKVSHINKADAADAQQILLDVLGLHPSSVEFYARNAQSFEQMHNSIGFRKKKEELFEFFKTSERIQNGTMLLEKFGYNGRKDTPDILKMLFFRRSDLLKGPLIDDMPLSESSPIRIYTEDQKNYIQWLIDAAGDSHDSLRKQQGFLKDKPPEALLYLMLQHALDLGFLEASLNLHVSAGIYDTQTAAAAYREPKFIHIQDSKSDIGSRWKHLYEIEPRITSGKNISVGSYIPEIIDDVHAETATLNDQLNALKYLEAVPTSRLERIFTEHIDTCTYRLDAWMLGLVNAQLSFMRGIEEAYGAAPSAKGLYLGAYSWLEDVRPKSEKLEPAEIDNRLSNIFNDPQLPLMVDNSNGGYIHAPSVNHAVTAAILRGGYLANASASSPNVFAVNLSSDRVRLALSVIEGMRNGQSLAALLGYRLERGIHDRHDVEVDEFIFDLRRTFPLSANLISATKEDDLDDIREIEARNVIDGLALIEQINKSGKAAYPFGRKDLPKATLKQKMAINSEVQRILDLNDAVADLALSESVHQVAQGNYDRAAATLDAFSKGNLPPTPDVITTPRSGVTLTHRVGLHLKAGLNFGDPADATPRAIAEPAINKWLTDILPNMDDIVCLTEFYNSEEDRKREEFVTMKDLKLLPIDLLYMVKFDNAQAMIAIDNVIRLFVTDKYMPRPDAKIEVKHDIKNLNGSKITLFELAPLLHSLRVLIQHSRPLRAKDVIPPAAAELDGIDEADIELDPLRITSLAAILASAQLALRNYISGISSSVGEGDIAAIAANIDDYINDAVMIFKDLSLFGLPQSEFGFILESKRRQFEGLCSKVEILIESWEKKLFEFDALMSEYSAMQGTKSDDDKFIFLQAAELKISAKTTTPLPALPDIFKNLLVNQKRASFENKLNDIRNILLENTISSLCTAIENEKAEISAYDLVGLDIDKQMHQLLIFAKDINKAAENLQKELDKRLRQKSDCIQAYNASADAQKKVKILAKAGKVLLGDDFIMVPEFRLTDKQATEWQNAYADRKKLLEYQTETLGEDFPVDGWLYGIARVREQMRHFENIAILLDAFDKKELNLEPVQFPYNHEDYWLALEYPDKRKDNTPFAIDEDKLLYTAHYPADFDKTASQCGLLLDEWTEVIPMKEETTGLTFHYDRPNSEPPQTLLLVTPSEFKKSWQWQDLVDTLHETIDMAKKRAIEPSHIDATEYARFLPATTSALTLYPITAALNLALNNEFYKEIENNE